MTSKLSTSRLTTLLTAIVDRRVKAVSQTVTNTKSFLQTLVGQAQAAQTAASGFADSSSQSASNSSLYASNASMTYHTFKQAFAGIHDNDPAVSDLGDPIIPNVSFYINSSTRAIRYCIGTDGSGNPIWDNGSAVPYTTVNGPLTITGTGQNAGVSIFNNNGHDLRLLQGDDGATSIVDITRGVEIFRILASLAYLEGNQKILTDINFTAANVLSLLITVDGAGSGLDADLFRGLPPSYYTDIVSRLGFTPVDVANYTGAILLAKIMTVDGIGSGLDTDLFRGQTDAIFLKKSEITYNSGAGTGSISGTNWWWRKQPIAGGKFLLVQGGTSSASEPSSSGQLFPIAWDVDDISYVDIQVTATSGNASATSGNKVGGSVDSSTTYTLYSDDCTIGVKWRAEAIVNS